MPLIIAMFTIVLSVNKLYAANTLKSITFEDEYMYNAIKKLAGKISSSNDSTKTIKMTEENINKVTELTLYYCNITNIKGIEKFTNLEHLDLWDNQISDISALSSLTNLTHFELYKQRLTIAPNGKNVELPKIFLQAKDPNSKIYTAEDYILDNCTLNADGTSVTVNDVTKSASVKIKGGEAYGTVLYINLLNLKVSKTTEELTNQNVGVTISSDKALKPLNGWVLSDDKLSLTKEYERNTKESVKVTAEDGSTATADISITNIDKDAPVIEYTSNENKDGSVEVVLIANEKIREVEGWVLSDDCMKLSKTYTEPTEELVEIYDLAGNKTDVEIEVKFKNNKLEAEEIVIYHISTFLYIFYLKNYILNLQ